MDVEITNVNYEDNKQAQELVFILNAYAVDPMGGGKPLDKHVTENLVNELSMRAYAFSIIGYVNNQPAGLVNCFEGFSTFSCKPLVNIHDVMVLKEFRGRGLCLKMLEKVEQIALLKGCCKLTLEVLSENNAAKSSYEKYGFSRYELDPKMGKAFFWQKLL